MGMNIIQKLVDHAGTTTLPFHFAILSANLELVKMLVNKNPELPNIIESESVTPLMLAIGLGQTNMTSYLHNVSRINHHQLPTLLNAAVESGMYGYAVFLLRGNSREAVDAIKLLEGIVGNPYAFRRCADLNLIESIIYFSVPINSKVFTSLNWEVLSEDEPNKHSTIRSSESGFNRKCRALYQKLKQAQWKMAQIVVPIDEVGELKQKHCEAVELVKLLCKILKAWDERLCDHHHQVKDVFILAIKNGMPEIVKEILQVYPDLIKHKDDDRNGGDYVLHYAVQYREEEIFNILHSKISRGERFMHYGVNSEGENILHVAARRPLINRLNSGSKVVLQMQRELRWYKDLEQELEKLVLPAQRIEKNKDGKTPFQVFYEEHQEMVKYEGEWIISMANSCIVGGSLIAAAVFAASITIPGGYNDNGDPIFAKDRGFDVFGYSVTLALVCSLTAVVIFLSIFTSRYSGNDFLYSLPNRLIIGLISLLLSVIFVMISFGIAVHLVFAEHKWLITPTAAVSCIPVFFFLYLQLPSLINLIKVTYGRPVFNLDKYY